MMHCKWVEDHLSDYIDHELDLSSNEQVDAHVAGCEHCQTILAGYRSMGTCIKASNPPVSTDAIWDRITCQLDSSSAKVVRGPSSIGSSWGPFRRLQNVPWSPLLLALAASIAILFLALRPFSEKDPERQGLAHDQHGLAVDFRDILALASTSPQQTIDLLVNRYDGKEMGLEETEQALGFEPTLFQTIPNGFKLVSNHVLNMPCCKCSATLCQQEDGTAFIVLEHREEQPVWFGDAPAIQTQCGAKTCKIVESSGHLAISWKNENRRLTLLGATDLTAVQRWITSIQL
ncbi:hypothetical protein VN12_00665 [Pirellula sp. SH-Sr6A]|uniref:zf-HC2 domain-containing protein n=1 Tax=Pirellula sp. SH-Sr6A TaxID=1632865 RepID=UPI00078E3823|nr:zf-HC2 domain-containing protein [Pirellula sp. SH-Sr6A]AMV30595.1 hypothetical protein VN12_00665 [Pirellula sp. SH-Sr6A]